MSAFLFEIGGKSVGIWHNLFNETAKRAITGFRSIPLPPPYGDPVRNVRERALDVLVMMIKLTNLRAPTMEGPFGKNINLRPPFVFQANLKYLFAPLTRHLFWVINVCTAHERSSVINSLLKVIACVNRTLILQNQHRNNEKLFQFNFFKCYRSKTSNCRGKENHFYVPNHKKGRK